MNYDCLARLSLYCKVYDQFAVLDFEALYVDYDDDHRIINAAPY
jgi:hypothetical protein